MDSAQLIQLVADGLSTREIAEVLGAHRVSIQVALKKLGIKARRTKEMFTKSDEDLAKAVVVSCNFREVLRVLGMAISGSSYRIVRRRVSELSLDVSHFDTHVDRGRKSLANLGGRNRVPDEQVLVAGKATSHHTLRRVLVKYIPYRCALCDNPGEWLGSPLILQVDHINGDHSDNRLVNLRWLCPNCHTQTPTFGGKRPDRGEDNPQLPRSLHYVRPTKILWPLTEELLDRTATYGFSIVAKELGVSDNAVRKRIRNHPAL